jgi:tRNA U54 and U55 pseudouridine synthase Pus10
MIEKCNSCSLMIRMAEPIERPESHVTDDALELYTLHMLSETDEATVEIHLLECSICQSALDRIEEEIALMRTALQGWEDRKTAIQLKTKGRNILIFKSILPRRRD